MPVLDREERRVGVAGVNEVIVLVNFSHFAELFDARSLVIGEVTKQRMIGLQRKHVHWRQGVYPQVVVGEGERYDTPDSRRQPMPRSLLFVTVLGALAIPALAQNPPPCPLQQPPILQTCVPATPPPAIPFSGDTGPFRVRKSAFQLTPAEVTELRSAFAALRALPQSDPRSGYAQGLQHCWNCGGGND